MEKQEQDTAEEQKAPIPLPTKLGMIALPMVPAVFIDMLTNGGITPPVLAAFGLSYVAFDRSPKVCAWLGKNRAFLSYLSTHPDALKNFDRLTNGYFSRQLGESNAPKDAIDTPDRIAQLATMPYGDYLQTPEWIARAKRIRARDGHCCSDCGRADGPLDVHHLTYERRGHEQDEDLLTLCRACHDARHGKESAPDAESPIVQPLPRRSPTFAQMRHLITSGRDVLGYDGQQFISAESLKQSVNFALIGVPGSGKTTALAFHAAQAIMRGAIVRGWDLHGDVAADLGSILHILEDTDEIVADCEWIQAERDRRMVLRKCARSGDREAARQWNETRELFYIVDEFNALMLRLKGRKKNRERVADTLLSLIAEGRKFKMRVILTGQTMPAALFGDQGSSARDIINTKYALQSREDHAQYFGIEAKAIKTLLPLISGEDSVGYAVLDGGPLMHAKLVSIPFTTVEDIRELIEDRGGYEPEEEEDDILAYIASRRRYELEVSERDTDPVQPVRYSSGARPRRDVAAIKQAREQRLRGVQQATVQDDELARGIKAYRSGARALDAFCAAMGYQKINQGRLLWAQVKLKVQEGA